MPIAAWLAMALFAAQTLAAPPPTVPAARIGAGTALVVDSEPDPAFSAINARVDVGRLRQKGDAIEAELSWPLRLGALIDARAARPGIDIPDGSASISRERIVCRTAGALSYAIEIRIVAPDGHVVDSRSFDAAVARRDAEEQDRAFGRSLGPSSYGTDPRSLVCRAAARRCDGHDFRWPPPPNQTPLEHSARADAMRKAYAAEFVPSCRLPA